MANLGLSERLVIFVLVVVFVGPDDLPKMMKFLGRTYGKIRRASDELRRAFTLEVDKVDAEHRATEIRRRREELLARRRAEAEERRQAKEGEPVARGDEAPAEVLPETPEHTAAAEQALTAAATKELAAKLAPAEQAEPEPAPAEDAT